MKITIAHEIFYSFEGIYFWRPLNFECLILKYTCVNGVLRFGLTILLIKWGKKKMVMIPFWGKKAEEEKTGYHNDISRWKRDSFSSEVKIVRGIVWLKMLKRWF